MKTEVRDPYEIAPLFGYILIKVLTNTTETSSGLVTPELNNKAEVMEIGDGSPLGDGKRLPMQVSPGDIIYYRKSADKEPVLINGDTYFFIEQRDVVGFVKQYEGSHKPSTKTLTEAEEGGHEWTH